MEGIHRWLIPEDLEAIELDIPTGVTVTAVQIDEEAGVIQMVELRRPADGSLVTFPEVQVWDDPGRSPRLMREESGWQEEDTTQLVEDWEFTRLTQFRDHLFPGTTALQVVYRIPPYVDEAHFHRDGIEFHGWEMGMVATIFVGFMPEGLEPWPKPKIITDVGPALRVV